MFELWKLRDLPGAIRVEFCGHFNSLRSAIQVLSDSRPSKCEGDCEYQITDRSGNVLVSLHHILCENDTHGEHYHS